MKRLALILALAHGTAGCAHQLTNRDVALGLVVAAGLTVIVIAGGKTCNELTTSCPRP